MQTLEFHELYQMATEGKLNMDANTLAALKSSIEHWERLASGNRNRHERVDASNCALCCEFNPFVTNTGKVDCSGCPIQEKTGLAFCSGTPFYDAEELAELPDWEQPLDTQAFRDAATLELEFLKSLLPKDV